MNNRSRQNIQLSTLYTRLGKCALARFYGDKSDSFALCLHRRCTSIYVGDDMFVTFSTNHDFSYSLDALHLNYIFNHSSVQVNAYRSCNMLLKMTSIHYARRSKSSVVEIRYT